MIQAMRLLAGWLPRVRPRLCKADEAELNFSNKKILKKMLPLNSQRLFFLLFFFIQINPIYINPFNYFFTPNSIFYLLFLTNSIFNLQFPIFLHESKYDTDIQPFVACGYTTTRTTIGYFIF